MAVGVSAAALFLVVAAVLLSNRLIGLLALFIVSISSHPPAEAEKAHSSRGERHAEDELHPAEREDA